MRHTTYMKKARDFYPRDEIFIPDEQIWRRVVRVQIIREGSSEVVKINMAYGFSKVTNGETKHRYRSAR